VSVRRSQVVALMSLLVALASGCQAPSSNSSTAAPAADAQGAANKATLTRFMDAMSQGDTTIVDSTVTEGIVDHQAMPGMAPGREGLKAMMTQFHAAFPDLKITVKDMTADGDKVWVRSTMTGTMKGEFMGMKPTGKSLDLEGFDLVRFENGKMAEHWGVQDNMSMMQQLGVTPPDMAAKKHS